MPLLWSSLAAPSPASDVRPRWAVAHPPEDADWLRADRVPVLVVSRDRASLLSLLEHLLRGSPEIEIVVDRRVSERRGGADGGDGCSDRRRRERRRRAPIYIH